MLISRNYLERHVIYYLDFLFKFVSSFDMVTCVQLIITALSIAVQCFRE